MAKSDQSSPIDGAPPSGPGSSGRSKYALLVVVKTPSMSELGRRFDIPQGRTSIGSSEGCDVALADDGLAPRLAGLERQGDRVWLVHEGEAPRLTAGGQPAGARVLLRHGDLIEAADTAVHFAQGEDGDALYSEILHALASDPPR